MTLSSRCPFLSSPFLRSRGIVKARHLPAAVLLRAGEVQNLIDGPYLRSGVTGIDLQAVRERAVLCQHKDDRIHEKVVAVAEQVGAAHRRRVGAQIETHK